MMCILDFLDANGSSISFVSKDSVMEVRCLILLWRHLWHYVMGDPVSR